LDKYKQALKRLNDEAKREAVDTSIEGPVMVIAGPGTGKTQTLALRIARILEKTQTNPQNILCLTFTENAALEMLHRLKEFIGPEAYKVKISTFHGFCDFLILENLEKFPRLTESSRALDDLEKLEIFLNIFSNLDIKNPYRNIKKEDVYLNDVITSISKLKREGISVEDFENIIDKEQIYFVRTKDIYKEFLTIRSNKIQADDLEVLVKKLKDADAESIYFKGVLEYADEYGVENRNALKEGIKKIYTTLSKENYFPRLKSLAGIYKTYQDELLKQGRYDFDDMITFVRDRLYSDENFLADVREQYHYILVDEYQDTNNAQNEVIDLISNFDNNPNLFVVGDDDQSIFRFQGANLENIIRFYKKYEKNLKLVTLTKNYRSYENIIKSSSQVIKSAENRLEDIFDKIDKDLTSHRSDINEKIQITTYLNQKIEAEQIAIQIKNLLTTTPPSEIAIILTKHSDIDYYTDILLKQGLTANIKKTTETMEDKSVSEFLLLVRFLLNPNDEYLLTRLLYLDHWKFDNLDIFKIINFSNNSNIEIKKILMDNNLLLEAKVSRVGSEKFSEFIERIANWSKLIYEESPVHSFKQILNESNFIEYLLLEDNNFPSVNNLYKLFQFIKSEFEKDREVTMKMIIEKLDLANEYNVKIMQDNLLIDENSINILTVHGSKGLEFEHVFMPLLKRSNWEGSRDRFKTKLPQSINKLDYVGANYDDKIRLFYVAMTRAKNTLHLSHPLKDDNGKDVTETMFISQIEDELKIVENFETNKEKLMNTILNEFIDGKFSLSGKDYRS
jgi:DNA helicase II / ATP-dependent DNA helicase PcrA